MMAESTNGRNDPGSTAIQPFRCQMSGQAQSWLIGLLLAAHASLVLLGSACDSATYCEPAALVSGIASWRSGRTDLYSVNPPLTKILAAAPVLLFLPLDTQATTLP